MELLRRFALSLGALSLLWLWTRPETSHQVPPLGLLLSALGILILAPSLPWIAWAWWGWTLTSTLWSQAPGDTLVLSLWELVYLAAFALGRWTSLWFAINLTLLAYILFTNLSLGAFGMSQYFSGSSFYTGGEAALTLIPPLFAQTVERKSLLAGLGLVLALVAALISGSRAVELSLLIILALALWRLRQEGIPGWRLLLVTLSLAALLTAADTLIPFHPIRQTLIHKDNLGAQVRAFQSAGSFSSRWEMWLQTFRIGLTHPLGLGGGTFRDLLPAYQLYPTVLFANPHDIYLDTLATLGWIGLGLLLLLLGGLWRGWNSERWSFALGGVGIWLTLAFDLSSMYPAVMTVAVMALGASWGATPSTRPLKLLPLLALPVLLWWYLPCPNGCWNRHFGYRDEVLAALPKLPPSQQIALLHIAHKWNPLSAWVDLEAYHFAQHPQTKLYWLEQINQQFPLESPFNYLAEAQLAWQLGDREQALEAIQHGLQRFPKELRPAKVPFLSEGWYRSWLQQAEALCQQIEHKGCNE